MTTANGQLVSTTKILDSGSACDRLNLLIMSEGYQRHELPQFEIDVDQFLSAFFGYVPISEFRCAFNVYRVNVESDQSGADDPNTKSCPGTGAVVDTYFDATFCNYGIQRLLSINNSTAKSLAYQVVPEWHHLIVIVNSTERGGSGGEIAVSSTGGVDWKEVAIHELGHSIFGLADEYPYWDDCAEVQPATYYDINVEPGDPNITIDTNRATVKWGDLILASTNVPTMANPDCSQCDWSNSSVSVGTVGTFEGAGYVKCGIHRAEHNCMMRETTETFCAVCQRAIRETLDQYMPECSAPLFSGTGSGWLGALICFFRSFAIILSIIVLYLFTWIPGIHCVIKRLWYRLANCRKGNKDPCARL